MLSRYFQNRKFTQNLVPNNVEFNPVCNKKLIPKLNVRDISYFQNKKITQKN
jgi:hypothetical protein